MKVGSVIDDQIHHETHVPLVYLGNHGVELGHRSVSRVDFEIGLDVVTHIDQRRFVDG